MIHSIQYFIRNCTLMNNEFHGSTSPQIHKNSMNIDDTTISGKLHVELLLFIAVVCTAYLCKKYFLMKKKPFHLIDHLCTCKKQYMCLYFYLWWMARMEYLTSLELPGNVKSILILNFSTISYFIAE